MDKVIVGSNSQIEFEIDNIRKEKMDKNLTRDEEFYFILMLLRSNMKDIGLTFPFLLLRKDRPDIVLKNKDKEIGIEITHAISEARKKAKTIRDKINPNFIIEPILHQDNKDKSYIMNTIEKSNNQLFGPAYIDDEPEVEAAEYIIESIKKKNIKFLKYDKFKENFLLIISDALLVDEDVVVAHVQKRLGLLQDTFFDKIILRIKGKNIFLF